MKAVYLLPCSCGKKVRVDAGQAGAKVDCECGRQLAVPTFRALQNLEVEAAPAAARGGQPADWNALRGILFSFGLLVTVVAIGVTGYYLYLYSIMSDGGERWKQAQLVEFSRDVDQMKPVDALMFFQNMEKVGLSVDGVPPWGAISSMRDSSFRWLTAGLASLAVGLASLVASLVGTGRSKKSP